MRSPASHYDARQGVAPIAFWQRHLRLIIFFVLATAGMAAVYFYYSPGRLAAENVAVAGQDSLLSVPIAKPRPDMPVSQRHEQSPGPLLVGLIAGHLGSDSGAECEDGLLEVEVNEELARQTAGLLRQHGVRSVVLQEFDERLDGFTGLALVSIHADSCQYFNEEATGYKIAHSNSPLATRLANCLARAYQEATQLPYHANTVTEHMTDYHAFREVPDAVPVAIIEAGFLNLDRELLTTHSATAAAGISNGVMCYLLGGGEEGPLAPAANVAGDDS